MAEIFLPVRLAIWQDAALTEHNLDTPDGKISNVEIGGTQGKTVYAVEDGILALDKWGQEHNAAELVSGGGENRIWNYRHFKATVKNGTEVQAGDPIGIARGGDLILGVQDDSSELSTAPAPTTTDGVLSVMRDFSFLDDLGVLDLGQDDASTFLATRLSRSALPVLDELDVLPLPQDMDPSADTSDERHDLSEGLTRRGKNKPLDPTLKGALYAGGGALALFGIYKLLK